MHALYSTCYPWRAACNCGVAIRSGKNLYVVRTCIEVSLQRVSLLSYPYERYDGCSQEDEITVQKMGTNYRVGAQRRDFIIFPERNTLPY